MKLKVFALVILIFFPGFLRAQVQQQNSGYKFTAAFYGVKPEGLKFEIAPSRVETLDFRAGERSKQFTVGSQVVFFREVPAQDGAKPARKRVAAAVIPTGQTDSLFLFIKNSNIDASSSADEFRIIILEDSKSQFPAGSVRFFNASGLELIGLINGKQVRLGGGLAGTFPATEKLIVQLAMRHKDRLIPSFNEELGADTTQRLFCILLPPESPKSPLIRWTFISDYIPQEVEVSPVKR